MNTMIKSAKKYKIKYIRSQRVIPHKHKSYFNYLYRNLHQLYLERRINTVDGYFEPSIINNSQYEYHYKRLSKLLRINNKIIEIMLHPRYKDDPETLFYSSKSVLELLSSQNLINYHNLS